ncbi:L-dopachrome tautomerase-related protein [Sphingomonas abietis]|uniref:L-dopachrome tautomerase-related protein n=1 Tax=Sphingomonas abietis TaxID=3012344 RepID=A0ABY7NL60_9SPHN|nr:L-dopachrome tautomerase-related protein [Sphingomonas abietis]WBO21307.1 L-dopachrome tautomerase-related protein [Sphingomonas abietis]
MPIPLLSRRASLATLAGAAACCRPGLAVARSAASRSAALAVAARSPWLCNGVAVTADGGMFLGLPRFAGHIDTPSLARVEADGQLRAFPGGTWNGWKPGEDGRDRFVMVNAVHVFADGSLWVVDQGSVEHDPALPQPKIVRLDARTGAVLKVLRFDATILPDGATMNDLRIHGSTLYVTDSGLGAIIVHDLVSGRTWRRLSKQPLLRKPRDAVQRGTDGRPLADGAGKRPETHSDVIEVDAAGQWLYWCAPTGPIRRIPTRLLRDDTKDDAALAAAIQTVALIPTVGGTAIDSLGNIYLSEGERRRITVLSPRGVRATLVEDDRLVSPDAIFIDSNRRLLVPAAQLENIAANAGGRDSTRAPWLVLSMPLPREVGGILLGDAVDGRTA